VINQNVLTALSAGQCSVTATSPGTAAIAGASSTYTLSITSPPKKKKKKR
jgi:hypothetical protein